jgi:hypothetical protein
MGSTSPPSTYAYNRIRLIEVGEDGKNNPQGRSKGYEKTGVVPIISKSECRRDTGFNRLLFPAGNQDR